MQIVYSIQHTMYNIILFTVHTVKPCKVQGVPRHIGSCIALNFRFWGLIRKFKKNESLKKMYQASIKICMQKMQGFLSSTCVFWL